MYVSEGFKREFIQNLNYSFIFYKFENKSPDIVSKLKSKIEEEEDSDTYSVITMSQREKKRYNMS